MLDFGAFLSVTWQLLAEAAPWFLGGLILAGLVWYFVRGEYISRLLARNRFRSVFRATVIGLPLPLCSCSVLPVAQQLRASGASRGSTAAFMVSTPETGADSIALTYSLTDPLLTVARPVTAFITALAVGGVELAFPEKAQAEDSSTDNPSSCSKEDGCDCAATSATSKRVTVFSSIRYAFTDLLKDLSPYLLVGFLLAGIVSVLLGDSPENLPEFLRRGWGGYIGALMIGMPMYICASSSTPLAAVLLGHGFSPGMILVFLLVGPATNLSALTVLKKILGGGGVVRYLTVIAILSILAGLLTDQLYTLWDYAPDYRTGEDHDMLTPIHFISGIVLGSFILYFSVRAGLARVRRFFA